MADATIQISGLGSSSAPLDYKLSGEQEFYLAAVRAIFDGTGAAGSFLPAVQLLSPAGTVMWQTEGTTVLAGGSADASFFPLRRTTAAAATNNYAQTVLGIATANTLRGYWRLGEAASPFADTSGYSGGPNDMTVTAAGTAYTPHVGGALPPSQDDGALQFNASSGTGYFLSASTNVLAPNLNTGFTLAGFVKPGPIAGTWHGSIFNNQTDAGFPFGDEEGWCLSVDWAGGVITGSLRRSISNAPLAASATITANNWTHLVGTYDGANLRLYVNGALAATTADARADTFAIYDSPRIARTQRDSPGVFYYLYGVIDEVSIWGVVLTPVQIATLYAASQ